MKRGAKRKGAKAAHEEDDGVGDAPSAAKRARPSRAAAVNGEARRRAAAAAAGRSFAAAMAELSASDEEKDSDDDDDGEAEANAPSTDVADPYAESSISCSESSSESSSESDSGPDDDDQDWRPAPNGDTEMKEVRAALRASAEQKKKRTDKTNRTTPTLEVGQQVISLAVRMLERSNYRGEFSFELSSKWCGSRRLEALWLAHVAANHPGSAVFAINPPEGDGDVEMAHREDSPYRPERDHYDYSSWAPPLVMVENLSGLRFSVTENKLCGSPLKDYVGLAGRAPGTRYVLIRLQHHLRTNTHANLLVLDLVTSSIYHFEPKWRGGVAPTWFEAVRLYIQTATFIRPLRMVAMDRTIRGPQYLESLSHWQKRLPFGTPFGKCLAWCAYVAHILIAKTRKTTAPPSVKPSAPSSSASSSAAAAAPSSSAAVTHSSEFVKKSVAAQSGDVKKVVADAGWGMVMGWVTSANREMTPRCAAMLMHLYAGRIVEQTLAAVGRSNSSKDLAKDLSEASASSSAEDSGWGAMLMAGGVVSADQVLGPESVRREIAPNANVKAKPKPKPSQMPAQLVAPSVVLWRPGEQQLERKVDSSITLRRLLNEWKIPEQQWKNIRSTHNCLYIDVADSILDMPLAPLISPSGQTCFHRDGDDLILAHVAITFTHPDYCFHRKTVHLPIFSPLWPDPDDNHNDNKASASASSSSASSASSSSASLVLSSSASYASGLPGPAWTVSFGSVSTALAGTKEDDGPSVADLISLAVQRRDMPALNGLFVNPIPISIRATPPSSTPTPSTTTSVGEGAAAASTGALPAAATASDGAPAAATASGGGPPGAASGGAAAPGSAAAALSGGGGGGDEWVELRLHLQRGQKSGGAVMWRREKRNGYNLHTGAIMKGEKKEKGQKAVVEAIVRFRCIYPKRPMWVTGAITYRPMLRRLRRALRSWAISGPLESHSDLNGSNAPPIGLWFDGRVSDRQKKFTYQLKQWLYTRWPKFQPKVLRRLFWNGLPASTKPAGGLIIHLAQNINTYTIDRHVDRCRAAAIIAPTKTKIPI